jgi:hypothetical protein
MNMSEERKVVADSDREGPRWTVDVGNGYPVVFYNQKAAYEFAAIPKLFEALEDVVKDYDLCMRVQAAGDFVVDGWNSIDKARELLSQLKGEA